MHLSKYGRRIVAQIAIESSPFPASKFVWNLLSPARSHEQLSGSEMSVHSG
jgi:hypothetical protein